MQLWNWRGLDVVNAHERDPRVYVDGMRAAVARGRRRPARSRRRSTPTASARRALGEAFELRARSGRTVHQGAGGDAVSAVATRRGSASSASAGSAATAWSAIARRAAWPTVAAIADPTRGARRDGGARRSRRSLDELLEPELDGIVIATPSALHAEQAIAALERGLAVFCQKPLARNARRDARAWSTRRARADRLLGVDLSLPPHRRRCGACASVVAAASSATVYAVDLVFHNAYGPDKPWFHDPALVRRRLRDRPRHPPGRPRAVDARASRRSSVTSRCRAASRSHGDARGRGLRRRAARARRRRGRCAWPAPGTCPRAATR